MNLPGPQVPCFVGLDWGSSNLRAYAVSPEGQIIAQKQSPAGILRSDDESRQRALTDLLAEWRARWGDLPVIASGMVGSRTGVREVPYVATPAGVAELRRSTRTVTWAGMRMSIIPGLMHGRGEDIDVLRGEETIACGWQPPVTTSADAHHLLVLPGTHSKWLTRHGDRVTGFTTFLTGELYDTLRRTGSLVGLLPTGPEPPVGADAFDEGLTIGLASHGLLHDIFALRAAVVAGARPAEGLSARLSGLLIGAEIAEARRRGLVPDDGSVQLVADGPNGDRYAAALGRAGLIVRRSKVDACLVRGWIAVAPTGSTDGSR